MIRRALTDEERAELRECIEANSRSNSYYAAIASASAVTAVIVYVLGFLCAGVVLWGIGQAPSFRAASHSYAATMVGWTAAGIWIVYLGWQFISDALKTRKRRRRLGLDLANREVLEERLTVRNIVRFPEPEHLTELLLIENDDGRFCAIWDDSTTNTEGERPKRSSLRIARTMNVVVYPASQRWSVRFLGEAVRKPKAIELIAKPSEWPDSNCWLPGQFQEWISRLSGAR